MVNSSQEYRDAIANNKLSKFQGILTLANSTVVNLENSDIMSGGLVIDDSVCETFQLGATIINKCELTLNNFDSKFDTYDFYGAVLKPKIGQTLSLGDEYIQKGVFTVKQPYAKGPIIRLTLLDNMHKLDRPFSEVTVAYPITCGALLSAICANCNVLLRTTTFYNYDYVIEQAPSDEATTCREMVSYIAQIACCFARCNTEGELALGWFNHLEDFYRGGTHAYEQGDVINGGDFTYSETVDYSGGTFVGINSSHNIAKLSSDPNIGTDDVVITGIQVTNMSEEPVTVLSGLQGYVIAIGDNPLIITSDQANVVADSIGAKLIGIKFRPLSAQPYNDPLMEAGDVGYVSDRKGNIYPTVFTSVRYQIGNYNQIECEAEAPLANSSVRYTAATKVMVATRALLDAEKTAREQAVQSLAEDLSNKSGLYQTTEDDGSGGTIYYLHNKPSKADSLIIWKMTAYAFGVSTDGGVTWNAGLSADGDAIVNRLSAVGIDASIIEVTNLKAKNILIGGENGYISFNDLTDKPNIPSEYTDYEAVQAWLNSNYSTYIDANGVYTGTIVANKITSGTLTGITIRSLGTDADMTIENGNMLISGFNGYLRAKLSGDTGYSKLIGMSQYGNIVIGHDDAVPSDYNGVRRDINIYTNSLDIKQNSNGGTPSVKVNGYTVITTANIGAQTVGSADYADNAGYASSSGGVNSGGWLGLFRLSSGGGYISYQDYGDNESGYVYIGASTLKANNILDNSTRDIKDKIENFDGDALGIISKAQIRKYKFKKVIENDDKVHIGLITDEAPEEILGPDKTGISPYAMASVAWKAIQEQQKQIDELKTEVEILKVLLGRSDS